MDFAGLSKIEAQSLRSVPAVLGCGFLFVTWVHLFLHTADVARELVEVLLPTVVALLVIGYGLRCLQQTVTALHAIRVSQLLALGLFAGIAVDVWFWVLVALEAEPAGEPAALLLNSIAIAWLFTLPIAHLYASLSQRAAELEEERSRLDNLSSIISHDLRNPLNVAQGYVELAASDANDSAHAEKVQEALTRMEAIIEDSLTLARTDAALETQIVDVASVATESWEMIAAPDAATLTVKTERDIHANRTRLKTLFENLFRNAVEHGGADVAVVVGDLPGEEGFYVADDGTGIPPDLRERVFEAGFSTTDGGTGLGLSIVRTIAKAHGWDHQIQASADGGVRVEFTGVRPA